MTAAVPRALAPWAPVLAGLAPEGVTTLGNFLPVIDRLVAAAAAPQKASGGEPCGFDGVTRGGTYDRLLLSEWALLDAAPDEFLRRAASGEHLFHRVALERPSGSRRVVVVVDCGPEQLGTPRLAHFAWMLVLGRRAAATQRELFWAPADDPSGLSSWSGFASLTALAQRRTLAAPAGAAAWAASLGPLRPGEERWVIGGGGVRALASAVSATAVTIRRDAETPSGALSCSVTVSGQVRSAILPLPPGHVAAALLKAPCRIADVTPGQEAVCWSTGKSGLAIRTAPGRVAFWRPGGDEVEVHVGGPTVVAASLQKRFATTFVVLEGDGSLRVQHRKGPDQPWITAIIGAEDAAKITLGQRSLRPVHGWSNSKGHLRVWILDEAGKLFSVSGGPSERSEPVLRLEHVVRLRVVRGSLLATILEPGPPARLYLRSWDVNSLPSAVGVDTTLDLVQSPNGLVGGDACVAARGADGETWTLSRADVRAEALRVRVPSGARVVAVLPNAVVYLEGEYGLWISKSLRGLWRLHEFSHPVRSVDADHSGHLAVCCADGVFVLSTDGKMLRQPGV